MWRERLARHGLAVRDPASERDVAAAERDLGARFPDELRALLLESDGAYDRYGFAVVLPAAYIVRRSHELWGLDGEQLYMAFAPHLFFGEEGDGGAYFFRVLGGEAGPAIFAWDHETDSRESYAYTLDAYVRSRALALGPTPEEG